MNDSQVLFECGCGKTSVWRLGPFRDAPLASKGVMPSYIEDGFMVIECADCGGGGRVLIADESLPMTPDEALA